MPGPKRFSHEHYAEFQVERKRFKRLKLAGTN
jgi:hypothetical protein